MTLTNLEQRALDCFINPKTPLKKKVWCYDGLIPYCALPEGVKTCCMQGELMVFYKSPTEENKYFSCMKKG